jgi:hypothetical protein
MTIVALPASLSLSPSPPLARQSRNAMPSRPSQTLSSCCAHTRCSHPRPRKSASCSILTITPVALHPPPLHGRSVRDPKIPIGPAQPNRASSFPWFPPYEAFGRRPRPQSQRACKGPPSETPSVNRTLWIAVMPPRARDRLSVRLKMPWSFSSDLFERLLRQWPRATPRDAPALAGVVWRRTGPSARCIRSSFRRTRVQEREWRLRVGRPAAASWR